MKLTPGGRQIKNSEAMSVCVLNSRHRDKGRGRMRQTRIDRVRERDISTETYCSNNNTFYWLKSTFLLLKIMQRNTYLY